MGKGESLTKENVIETTRTWLMTREMVVSTLLGLLVVVGMRIIDNVWSVLGLIALVFINYYLLMGRKRKLSILDSGSLMYYTEDLDRQVIRLRHYDHVKIKGHLFNFGVLNIIYLELIGIVMNSEVDLIGENTVWVKALVTILVYVIAFNYTSKKHSELVDKELKKQIETNNKGVLITLTPSEKEEVASYYGLKVGNRNSSVEQDKQEEESIKEPQEETLVDVIAEDMVEEVADELVEDLLKEEIKEEVATEKDIQEKLVPVLEQVAHKKETEMKNRDIVTVKPYNESESEIVSYDWEVKEEDTQEVEEENNQEVEEGNNKVEEDNNQEDIMVRPTEYTSKVIESKLLAYKEENKDGYEEDSTEDSTEDKDEDTSNEEGITVDFLDDIHVISDVKTMSLTNGYYKKR